MGEPKAFRSATSYKPVLKKKITVKGPLGWFFSVLPTDYIQIWGDGRICLNYVDVLWADECVACVRLGTLDMDVPEFVDLVQNAEEKTATLSVRDPNAKEQKAMWGMFFSLLSLLLQLPSHSAYTIVPLDIGTNQAV